MTDVRIKKLKETAIIPKYMSEGASGCDVYACLEEPLVIEPRGRCAIPTGLAVEIPKGFEIQVRPRSGLSYKQGLTVVNAPGTIDSDYRGEIRILAINVSDEVITLEPGTRIAQLVLQRVEQIQWLPVSELENSARDAGGFGSTGLS